MIGVMPDCRRVLLPIRVLDTNNPVRGRGKFLPPLHDRTEEAIPPIIPAGDDTITLGMMERYVAAIAAGELGSQRSMATGALIIRTNIAARGKDTPPETSVLIGNAMEVMAILIPSLRNPVEVTARQGRRR